MKKILNERLGKISALIHNNENVADIGCDHALLGIYLSLNRKNIHVIASDINYKPLIKAKENIEKYMLTDKISLKCGDGLKVIDNDVNTVIISGMGSISIINILQDINNYPQVQKIILSPNNDFSYLRDEMNKLGFKIEFEEMVYEKGKYYLVIEYFKGKEKINNLFGKLDLKREVNRKYFLNIINKNNNIINKITDVDRKKMLEKENKMIIKKLK